MLIVKKFGGSSVADRDKIFNVARRCIEDYEKGNDIVVVLSAMGHTTDELIAKAREISGNPPKRELDMLLATGEQVSCALMAMAIQSLGVSSVSLNAMQVPMNTSSVHGSAKLEQIGTERILNELKRRRIVIVTGFQGVNENDDITTLGRGGSDTTAVALAAVLHADACEIYTDVDGVYTADPRLVPNARKMSEVTYDEMLELASLGANVLHNRSVELAKKYGVKLTVRSSLTREEGTVVKENVQTDRLLVSGVAADKNTARVSISGVRSEPGVAFKIFNCLAKNHINVDVIIQSLSQESKKNVSFTVARTDLADALKVLNDNLEAFDGRAVEYDETVAKISVIGEGMTSNSGVAAKMFEALGSVGANIKEIATSDIRITVLIDETDVDRAMCAVHDAFGLGQ